MKLLEGLPRSKDEQVVQVLEYALAEALDGKVTSVAVILCSPNSFSVKTGGHQAEQLYLGAGSLQRKILTVIEGKK